MRAINCGKDGCFEIAKLEFSFKTEYFFAETVVLEWLTTDFDLQQGDQWDN